MTESYGLPSNCSLARQSQQTHVRYIIAILLNKFWPSCRQLRHFHLPTASPALHAQQGYCVASQGFKIRADTLLLPAKKVITPGMLAARMLAAAAIVLPGQHLTVSLVCAATIGPGEAYAKLLRQSLSQLALNCMVLSSLILQFVSWKLWKNSTKITASWLGSLCGGNGCCQLSVC